jgi:hypothetical protein
MTKRLFAMLVMLGVTTLGCATETDDEAEDIGTQDDAVIDDMQDGLAKKLPESVQILHGDGKNFCTGVLVAPKLVLGAAHCIWGNDYKIRAPFVDKEPVVKVKKTEVLSRDNSDPSSRDLGIFVLEEAIKLDQYAIPTKIGKQADDGEKFKGVAVGRKKQERMAPLVKSKTLTIKSGKDAGYTNGLKTEYYSSGGDSGGPLFLVEDGKITHKLVGVERQPEPKKNVDWFTRIDDKSLDLIKKYK